MDATTFSCSAILALWAITIAATFIPAKAIQLGREALAMGFFLCLLPAICAGYFFIKAILSVRGLYANKVLR